MNKRLFIFLLVLSTLPVILFAQKQIQQLLGLAAPKPANIIIETKNILGPINKSWAAFSQGGEEAPPILSPVISKMKELSPRLIRIDHVYDFNKVVQKNGNNFIYDFTILDKVVDDIIAMGAVPFFSLSYMPSVFTSSGSVIDVPTDWSNWKNLIKATIQHYSGKNDRNLTDVYYEVWNEPELPQFGEWKLSEPKDYRLLYFYTATGAKEATNVNNFYIGGPSVGSYYSSWVSNFLSYIAQNNLRLDFYSWHRYTKKPYEYESDVQNIRNLLSSYSSYANMPLILTEWGIDSENSQINNTNTAASHAVYSVSKFNQTIKYAFNFEVKDGPSADGGKWGLLYHERDPQQPLAPKPKFKAFAALAKLSGNQILLSGDSIYVSGLAVSTPNKISVILANFDVTGKNIENVPVTFTGIDPAIYNLKYDYVLDNRSGFYEISATNGSINKNFIMPANSIIYLELTKISKLATFINGLSNNPGDKALVLNNTDGQFTFSNPDFHLLPEGSITFDLKPLWEKNDNNSFYILAAPFEIREGIKDKLSLFKQKSPTGNFLVFSVTNQQKDYTLPIPIDNWEPNTWHHIELGWNQYQIWLSVDGQRTEQTVELDIRNGKILSFSPIEGAIDNLKIILGKDLVIERSFDGRVDK